MPTTCVGVGFGIVMPTLNTVVVTLASGQLRASLLALDQHDPVGITAEPIAFTMLTKRYLATAAAGYRVVLPVFEIVSIVVGVSGWVVAQRVTGG